MRAVATIGAVALLAGGGVGGAIVLADRSEHRSAAAQARLVFVGQPRLVTNPSLPDDRILAGTIRNASARTIEIDREEVVLLDASGRPVDGDVIFLASFVHPIAPLDMGHPASPAERLRVGWEAHLEPGGTVPIVISWRRRPGEGDPATVRYAAGAVSVPATATG